MIEIKCPLCNNRNVSRIEAIDTRQLEKLYKTRAGIDVKRFFENRELHLYRCPGCDLKFYSPQIVGDGKFYDDLQDYPDYFLKDKTEYSEAARYINSNDDVLEIGCGEGMFAGQINCKSYLGLEFSDRAIEKARSKNLRVLKQSLEEHAKIAEEKYDVVCFFQVLEHVSDPGKFIEAAIKCLKPGGTLLLAVPSEDSFIRNVPNFYLNMPPHHVSHWSDQAIRSIADIFNLRLLVLKHETLNPAHRSFYLKTTVYRKIVSFLGLKFHSMDPGATNTTIYSISVLISYLLKPFFTFHSEIIGQSVLCVFRKS